MEIFVSEKDDISKTFFIGYKKHKKYDCGLDMETRFEPEICILENHDSEILASERQKVISELEEWISKNVRCYINEVTQTIEFRANRDEALQKLKELKGE